MSRQSQSWKSKVQKPTQFHTRLEARTVEVQFQSHVIGNSVPVLRSQSHSFYQASTLVASEASGSKQFREAARSRFLIFDSRHVHSDRRRLLVEVPIRQPKLISTFVAMSSSQHIADPSSPTTSDWAHQAESSLSTNGVPTPPLAPTPGIRPEAELMEGPSVIVIDAGSGFVRAGFCGHNSPDVVFATVVGRPR